MTEMQNLAVAPFGQFWRLSVGQYERMVEAGILTSDDPVELLEGYLIKKGPKTPPRSFVRQTARRKIAQLLPSGWFVDVQEPFVTQDSEPEPDVMIVRGEVRQYATRHPRASEVAVIFEVTDATYYPDRMFRKRIYARAGVPVYVIINLPQRQVEMHTEPTGPAAEPDYQQRRVYSLADSLPILLEGQEVGAVAARDLLP